MLTLTSISKFHEIVILYSLDDAVERCIVKSYAQDIERVCKKFGCPLRVIDIRDRGQLQYELDKIYERACGGIVPILQIVMHGDLSSGVVCRSGVIGWGQILIYFRKINIKCRNNLIVISSVCFSMHLALEANVTMPAPFNILIAPEFILTFRHFATQTQNFIEILFEERDAILAYYCTLQQSSAMYHCQEVLFQGLARFIQDFILDDAGEAHVEYQVRKAKMRLAPSLPDDLLRTTARQQIGDIDSLLSRSEQAYLIGSPAGFTARDLEAFVRHRKALRASESASN